jgi:hypothetical protein
MKQPASLYSNSISAFFKKDGSALELLLDNFRSGAEVNGEKSLKKGLFSYRWRTCIFEKTITRELRIVWLNFWRTFLFGENDRGIKYRIGFLYVS